MSPSRYATGDGPATGPAPTTSTALVRHGLTEFEILKASHKFLRDEDEEDGGGNTRNLSWDEKLAAKYYANLYKEFAVCDLKHYKSGSFALRWRTESEVVDGAGEMTCGNTRCALHSPRGRDGDEGRPLRGLTTLELPFAYEEHGQSKSALVKVVLCKKCLKKLMYKRMKEKGEEGRRSEGGRTEEEKKNKRDGRVESRSEGRDEEEVANAHGKRRREDRSEGERKRHKIRSESRSRSRERHRRDNHHVDDDDGGWRHSSKRPKIEEDESYHLSAHHSSLSRDRKRKSESGRRGREEIDVGEREKWNVKIKEEEID